MSKNTERLLAKELYLATQLTQREMAERVGVTEKTLGKWARDGKWEEMRLAQNVTREALLKQAYVALDRINKAIDGAGGIPTKLLNDAKSVAVREILALERRDGLSPTVAVMERFLSYLYKHHPAMARDIAPIQLKFVEERAHETAG